MAEGGGNRGRTRGEGGWGLAGWGHSWGLVGAGGVTVTWREFREGHRGADREGGGLLPVTVPGCGVQGEGLVARGLQEEL